MFSRGHVLFLLLVSCVTVCQGQFQRSIDKNDSLYSAAEKLFNLPQPTAETDTEALATYAKIINSFESNSTKQNDSLKAVCHQRLGAIYQDRGDLQKALKNYLHTLAIKTNLHGADSPTAFEELIHIGTIHYYSENYDSADTFLNQAERMYLRNDTLESVDRLYNVLGALQYLLGNNYLAIKYYEKALAKTDKEERDYDKSVTYFTTNIANAKSRMGDYRGALPMYRELLNKKVVVQSIQTNLGIAYNDMHYPDSAAFFLSKALTARSTDIKLRALNELGIAYIQKEKFDSAASFLYQSIKLNLDSLSIKNSRIFSAFQSLANIKQVQSSFDSALHYYQLALINTTFDFNDSTVTANPQDITQAISLLQLFEVLKGKAAAWNLYYQQDQDLAKLNHSLTTYQLAIRVAQHIQKTYDNDEAKLFLVNKVAPVYEEAIATAVQLHRLTNDPRYVAQAFQFSEASKAAVLTESLRDVKIKSSDQVSDSLVQDEHRIKQQITALRLKLVESHDSAQNERYRQQLIDQEIALARTIKYLQKDEHYYQRKYQPDSLDIAALQKSLLTDDEALLEYFVGQKELYVFALRRGDLRVASVTRTAELDSALQRTQRHLYHYRAGQGEDAASLATLYRYLITPMADAVADARKLIIVPDGPLHYLPFDLLSADGQRANYLLHTHTLHYGYSASLLRQAIDERRGYPTEAVLAMAPFTGGEAGNVRSQGFSLLRDSQAEVESVGGSIYTEGQATKRRFLRVAGSYNVLHLATHATVNAEDPSQSFIAFYPQQRDSVANYRLYTHELYNMRLDSVKLVILSACEAGNGQLVRGEGVMSLARAFAYAGCPNTVTTLWKADDRSSAQLTTQLHHYLKQGWEKDEALRQAKLDYLNDPTVHPAQKAPYYWANFVFIGDPAPIYDNDRWWWLAIGVLLAGLVGGWLLWRRQKRVRLKQMA